MKFKIDCKSILLQEALTYMLKDFLDEDGKLITDYECNDCIVIGKDIKKPFIKNSLFAQLNKILNSDIQLIEGERTIEEKIDKLCSNFKEELLKLIKEHYEKK